MTLDEAMAIVEGFGYSIVKVERRKLFRKAYTIYTEFLGTSYMFKLDNGQSIQEDPFEFR